MTYVGRHADIVEAFAEILQPCGVDVVSSACVTEAGALLLTLDMRRPPSLPNRGIWEVRFTWNDAAINVRQPAAPECGRMLTSIPDHLNVEVRSLEQFTDTLLSIIGSPQVKAYVQAERMRKFSETL